MLRGTSPAARLSIPVLRHVLRQKTVTEYRPDSKFKNSSIKLKYDKFGRISIPDSLCVIAVTIVAVILGCEVALSLSLVQAA
jgi:hypothetical protein